MYIVIPRDRTSAQCWATGCYRCRIADSQILASWRLDKNNLARIELRCRHSSRTPASTARRVQNKSASLCCSRDCQLVADRIFSIFSVVRIHRGDDLGEIVLRLRFAGTVHYRDKRGISDAGENAIMIMTTSNSIRVKARVCFEAGMHWRNVSRKLNGAHV